MRNAELTERPNLSQGKGERDRLGRTRRRPADGIRPLHCSPFGESFPHIANVWDGARTSWSAAGSQPHRAAESARGRLALLSSGNLLTTTLQSDPHARVTARREPRKVIVRRTGRARLPPSPIFGHPICNLSILRSMPLRRTGNLQSATG